MAKQPTSLPNKPTKKSAQDKNYELTGHKTYHDRPNVAVKATPRLKGKRALR